MDPWQADEVRAIVKALRYCLETLPPGSPWAVKQVSGELRYWLDLERKLSGRPAPAHSHEKQAGQPAAIASAGSPEPGRGVMTTRPREV